MTTPGTELGRSLIGGFLSKLRFPQLFAVAAILFVVDLLVPDLIPFVDEVLLGIVTLLLGSLQNRRDTKYDDEQAARPPIKDVTPPDEQ